MAFTSVPEERFLTDVLKTWLTLFSENSNFSGVNITPNYPDKDTAFELPCIVVNRVGSARWVAQRLSGYYGVTSTASPGMVGEMKGLTYSAMYQLDVLSSSILQQQSIVSKINSILKGDSDGVNTTILPLKDFSDETSAVGTETDLKIKFRFWRDVMGSEVSTFDPTLHQYSISIDFWIDYITENEVPAIDKIEHTFSLDDSTDSENDVISS